MWPTARRCDSLRAIHSHSKGHPMISTVDITSAPRASSCGHSGSVRSAAANCSSLPRPHRAPQPGAQRGRHPRRRGGTRRGNSAADRAPRAARRRPSARFADHDQGLPRDGRPAHHRRGARVGGLRSRARRPVGRPAQCGGRRDLRQDQPADVRDGLADVQPGVRHDEQPVGPGPNSGRLLRRFAAARRLRVHRPRARQRYRRLDAQPAHNTGVFTLKPSFGIIPVRGHIPGPPGMLSAPDLGVLGPLGRSADDLDLALDVLAGPDAAMATAWRLRLPRPAAGR